jgi:hypothetical protein
LIGQQILERQLHAVGHVDEALVVADQLILDPLIDRNFLEAPLTIELDRWNLAGSNQLIDGSFVEMQINRELVDRQQLSVWSLLFRHRATRAAF